MKTPTSPRATAVGLITANLNLLFIIHYKQVPPSPWKHLLSLAICCLIHSQVELKWCWCMVITELRNQWSL